MRQQDSEPELSVSEVEVTDSMMELALDQVDDPFQDLPFQLLPERRTNPPPPAESLNTLVMGPNGNELVDPKWCEEPTRIMSKEESARLLEKVREDHRLENLLKQGLHTRPTVRSMQAVMPPSSRRPPVEVKVVEVKNG